MYDDVNEILRGLYKTQDFQAFADWAADFRRNPSETTVEHAARAINLSKNDAAIVLQTLCQYELGDWILGRRGSKTRAAWRYPISDIAKAMQGKTQLTLLSESRDDDSEDYQEEIHDNATQAESLGRSQKKYAKNGNVATLSKESAMIEAKRLIAEAYNVSEKNIEIVVRF